MAQQQYVAPTIEGLQKLSNTHELSKILKGVFDIFNGNPIDITGEGVLIQVHIVGGKIAVELVGGNNE